MKKIKLTQGKYALVDDCHYDYLNLHKWYAYYCKHTGGFYAGRKISIPSGGQSSVEMHRTIMGVSRSDMQVDHNNHNTLDNRYENLRLCTHSQNMMNRGTPASNTSGYKGVNFAKSHKKWMVRIGVNKSRKFLGFFDCKHEAARVYNLAAKMYHGEYAFLNEIDHGYS